MAVVRLKGSNIYHEQARIPSTNKFPQSDSWVAAPIWCSSRKGARTKFGKCPQGIFVPLLNTSQEIKRNKTACTFVHSAAKLIQRKSDCNWISVSIKVCLIGSPEGLRDTSFNLDQEPAFTRLTELFNFILTNLSLRYNNITKLQNQLRYLFGNYSITTVYENIF